MSHLLARKNPKHLVRRLVSTALFSFLLIAQAYPSLAKSISGEADIFTKCWEYSVNAKLDAGFAVDGSSVYFIDDENKLVALDIAGGNKLWSSELGGKIISNLFILEDSILLVTGTQSDDQSAISKATLRAISRRSGITDWSAEITPTTRAWIGFVAGQVVTVGGDGSLSAIASATGKTVWQIDLKSPVVATPYFNESGIEIATNRNEVVNVSGTDGRVHVDWKSKYLPTAVLVDSNGRLVVGDERGNFVSVSSGGSRLWGFRNGAQISSATLYGSEYLAASYDNFLYKLSRSGDVKWKRRLSGRVNDGPFALADTAIVSIVGTGSVYVIDLKKGKISNRIEGGEEVSLRVVAATNASGFAVAGPSGISYFSSAKCPAK